MLIKLFWKKLEQHYGNQISIRLLDKLYPDYQIDINAEQEAIKKTLTYHLTVSFLLV